MPYIAGYLLKLSVSLSVVYLFYVFVLRRLTFYNWNRWYLAGYSFLAFLIPFVNISPVLENNRWDKNAVLQFIPMFSRLEADQANLTGNKFAWWTLLLAGASVGIMLMLIRFLVRYISFQRIRSSAQLMVDGGVKVYHVDKSIIPFSFGNAIFINPQLHSEEDLAQIIHHEFIHVKQKHTIDILWGELLCMLNWYNPFAWMIRKAMRQNLEFIADHKVLENGIDKKHYQYLLLKVTGAAHFSITQQFNFSSLKKRIIMMNRSRSAKIQLTRFLFLLPLLTVLLLAFRQNVIKQIRLTEVASSAKEDEVHAFVLKLKEVADTVPALNKIERWKEDFLKRNTSVKNISIAKEVNGSAVSLAIVVTRRDGVTEKFDWSDPQARKQFDMRYKGLPLSKDAIEKVDERIIVDTAFVDASLSGPGNPYLKPPGSNVLLVIDKIVQEDGAAKLNKIDPATIERINVLKGESATKIYGDKAKGKEGVIEVETINGQPAVRVNGSALLIADSIVFNGKPVVTITGKDKLMTNLYVVDGVEYSPAEFEKLNIDANTIETITVIKDETAVKKYGEKARNGVIEITLKKPITKAENDPHADDVIDMFRNSDKPVWAVNGYTYAVSSRLSTAMAPGIINTVIVDDRFYTIDEANRLFKRSEFTAVGTVDAKTVFRVHGRNEPAIILGRKDFNWKKYEAPRTGSVNQP
jgi:hypothetical protein